MLRGLDHYNLDTSRPADTIAFYCDLLGCEDGNAVRPDFGFPGAWLLVDGHPVIHINFIGEDRAGPTGAFNHIAFEADGYLAARERLDAAETEYSTSERPEDDLFQIFLFDPNRIRVELNFRGEAEAIAAARAAS